MKPRVAFACSAAFLIISVTGCDLGTKRTFLIDQRYLGRYPAVFLSLDEDKIVPVPEPLRGSEIVADLWIEPQGPSIAPLSANFEGARHVGADTKLADVNVDDYKGIKRIPPNVKWRDYIDERIHQGLVFLVKSSTEKVYKVRIDHLSNRSIALSYARLK